jgi:predicted RNA binding protein YcfA (HicA-like mRNA interferase family)
MKKIPRDIAGYELIKIIGKFGYQITRQTGSHIRLTTTENGIHHITVPNHNPLKIGTLSNILSDIADHFGISKKELLEKLF